MNNTINTRNRQYQPENAKQKHEDILEELLLEEISNDKKETEYETYMVSKGDPDSLPTGQYQAEIAHVDVVQHPQDMYDIVRMKLRILGGEYNGMVCPKIYYLKSTPVIEFLKKECASLGVIIEKREDLRRKCLEVLHKKVTLNVVYKMDYMVVYITGAIVDKDKKMTDYLSLWE